MTPELEKHLIKLAQKRHWDILEVEPQNREDSRFRILAEGKEFRLAHPGSIYLKLYRRAEDPESKFRFMHEAHDILWPDHIRTWNDWEERRFRAHCAGHSPIVLAAGASAGKSLDVAKIAVIFYASAPKANACVIASTTIDSLQSRIWGYATKLIEQCALPLGFKVTGGSSPKVMHHAAKNKIHGMFAVAPRPGDDDKNIATIIGRHPDDGLMVILDEATDMPSALLQAIANLESGEKFFQLWAIGNSNSKNDLHGALATPALGWPSIDPMRDKVWKTQYKNGICLYFNPHDSPAIKDPDPVKRSALSKFLITAEGLAERKITYGEDSNAYYRFVLGFWKSSNIDNTVTSEQFLNENQVYNPAEWSGFYPLRICAGLDPAFQIGGTGCILRLALYGQAVDGKLMLDYRGQELLFRVDAPPSTLESAELLLARNIADLLRKYNCPVNMLVIDASGVGRALGELIRLVSGENEGPKKIVANRGLGGLRQKKADPSIIIASPSDLWFKFREFVQTKQIHGLDAETMAQIVNRQVVTKDNKLILESKTAYRNRMAAINPSLAHSPDEADAAMLCLQSAILNLGFFPGQKRAVPNELLNSFHTEKMNALRAQSGPNLLGATTQSLNRPKLVPNFSQPIESLSHRRLF